VELKIDGKSVVAMPGQSLLDLIRQLGLYEDSLSKRPIAARIAGEIFNLNYIPVRESEADPERPSIRKAMAASKGVVQLLRYSDPSGKDVYSRTVQFVLFLALHRLWPNGRFKMNCTVGSALFISVDNAEDFDALVLKKEVERIVSGDFPLIRRRIPTGDAIAAYEKAGQQDKARLLQWRTETYFDQYISDDFADYYYGELAPTTGYLQVWDIRPVDGGFLFIYPDDSDPNRIADYQEMPNFLSVSTVPPLAPIQTVSAITAFA